MLHVWNLSQYSLHKTLPVFEVRPELTISLASCVCVCVWCVWCVQAVEGVVVLSVRGEGSGKRRKRETEPLMVATAGDKG